MSDGKRGRTWRAAVRRAGAAVLAGLSLAACGDGPSAPGGTTSLTLLLTDAPGDIENAWVEVTGIYLQGEGGRTVLYDDEVDPPLGLVELTSLGGGDTESIVEGLEVPAGLYTQLRFVIGRAAVQAAGEIFATDGVSLADLEGATGELAGALICPSCSQSGLKVKLPDGHILLESGQQIVVVDFDVAESYGRLAGRSGTWVMHPVMHATEFTVTGMIAGSVALAPEVALPLSCGGADLDQAELLDLFVPQATDGTITKSGVSDGAAGTYAIAFVPPGEYDMTHVAEVDFANGDALAFSDVTATPPSVAVDSDATATSDYAIGGATCTPSGG